MITTTLGPLERICLFYRRAMIPGRVHVRVEPDDPEAARPGWKVSAVARDDAGSEVVLNYSTGVTIEKAAEELCAFYAEDRDMREDEKLPKPTFDHRPGDSPSDPCPDCTLRMTFAELRSVFHMTPKLPPPLGPRKGSFKVARADLGNVALLHIRTPETKGTRTYAPLDLQLRDPVEIIDRHGATQRGIVCTVTEHRIDLRRREDEPDSHLGRSLCCDEIVTLKVRGGAS